MESKYKVGQVVTIAEYLESFEISEHRHLTDVMKEAYSNFALIVDVKPAEGLTDSKDDGFNYYLKIYRDRSYVKECESEYWTSDLFEECATPKYDNDYVYDNNGNMIPTYSIGQGFHTCKSIDACLKIVNPHFAENLVIAECIIPRGSFYYTGRATRFTNDDYYASNALKIEKIIVDLKSKNYVLPLQ